MYSSYSVSALLAMQTAAIARPILFAFAFPAKAGPFLPTPEQA